MPFQFQCPNCEWLEADEVDIGQIVVCPVCEREIVVPQPTTAQIASSEANESAPPLLDVESAGFTLTNQQQLDAADESPRIQRRSKVKIEVDGGTNRAASPSPIGLDEPELYHIACDQGFVMEVPKEMIGTEALCPCCEQRMTLDLRRTFEFQRQREWEARREDTKLSKFWLNTAIIIAAVVVSGVLLMLVIQILS